MRLLSNDFKAVFKKVDTRASFPLAPLLYLTHQPNTQGELEENARKKNPAQQRDQRRDNQRNTIIHEINIRKRGLCMGGCIVKEVRGRNDVTAAALPAAFFLQFFGFLQVGIELLFKEGLQLQ